MQPVSETKALNLDKSSIKPTSTVILEDWQLTGRYKRKPISQEEIDFINVNLPFYSAYQSNTDTFYYSTERRPTVIYLQNISYYQCILEY